MPAKGTTASSEEEDTICWASFFTFLAAAVFEVVIELLKKTVAFAPAWQSRNRRSKKLIKRIVIALVFIGSGCKDTYFRLYFKF